jgi:large repetitive protein
LAAVNVVIRNLADSTGRQLVSDSDGNFVVKDLTPGTYQISASKEGFATPSATTVEVALNRTTNANLQLSQGVTGSLRGVVVAPDGFSLAGAKIAIHGVAGALNRDLVTDPDGMFIVRDLPPGSYQVIALKDGFTSSSPVTVEVAQNRTANANVLLAETKPVQIAQATPAQTAQVPGAQSALPPKAVDPSAPPATRSSCS